MFQFSLHARELSYPTPESHKIEGNAQILDIWELCDLTIAFLPLHHVWYLVSITLLWGLFKVTLMVNNMDHYCNCMLVYIFVFDNTP